MAASGLSPHEQHETRNLVAGILIGLVCMVAIVVVTLFELGYIVLSSPTVAPPTSSVFTAEDLEAPARPTAVWKFRPEWLTPRVK